MESFAGISSFLVLLFIIGPIVLSILIIKAIFEMNKSLKEVVRLLKERRY